MSFLSQVVFYFVNNLINFLANDLLSFDITDGFKFILIGVSAIMTVIGFIAIFRTKGQTTKYLDIPLIFVASILKIVFDMYVSVVSYFALVPSVFGLIPGIFYTIRVIRWIIDVAKKRRKPQRKNAIVVVAYILAAISVFALTFVDFSGNKQKPTEEEIDLVDKCFEYKGMYLYNIPTYEPTLIEIEKLTGNATENDVFIRCYKDTLFYKTGDNNILNKSVKVTNMNRRKAYAEIVALRLKTLIALKDYKAYNEFFVDNCGYLFYVDNSFYFDLWKNDDYALTEADLATIISGYKNILSLCDNDIDRYFILGDITDFYYQFDSDNKEMEEFENTRNDIFSSLDLEETINKLNDSTGGYYSESLAVE